MGVGVIAVPTATPRAIDCIHSPITAMMTSMITTIPTINPTSGPVTGIAVGSLPMQKLPSLVWHAGGEYIVKMTAWYEMIGNKNPLTAHFTDKGEFRYATRCWEHLQPPSTGSKYHTILWIGVTAGMTLWPVGVPWFSTIHPPVHNTKQTSLDWQYMSKTTSK